MKKRFYHINLALWLLALFCLPARADQIDYAVTFSADSVHVTQVTVDTVTYSQVTYSGLTSVGTAGQPLLPCMFITFSVPYDAINIEAVTYGSSSTSIHLPTAILPCEQGYFMSDSVIPPLTPDPAIYNSNFSFPSDFAEVVSEGYYMGENKVVTVAVYPMKYVPSHKRMRLNSSFTVTLYYDRPSGGNPPGNMLVRKSQSLRQQAWDELKTRVVNPNQVEGFAIQTSNPMRFPDPENQIDSAAVYGGNLDMIDRSCEYMIVTTDSLRSSFRRIAALKRQKGYTVQVKTIESIISDTLVQYGDERFKEDGTATYINDYAGKLRAYLRYYHTFHGTQYVLLGGRSVPYRYYNEQAPTDLYYSDLTTNWNKNGNTKYGEMFLYNSTQGFFDMNPELYVGRLFAGNDDGIYNYSKKLFRYELNPGKGNTSYLSRAFSNQGFSEGIRRNIIPLIKGSIASAFPDTTFWTRLDNTFPTGIDVIDSINAHQYGMLAIHGHGHYNCVNVNNILGSYINYVDSLKSISHTKGIDCLNNKYYPNVFYSLSCSTIPYDNPNYNIGQSYTEGNDYGGVAFWGNTRDARALADTALVYGAKLEELFFNCIKEKYYKAGVSESISKLQHYVTPNNYFDCMVHNLIGDPEFDIHNSQLSPFTNISVTRNANSIVVNGTHAGDTVAFSYKNYQGRIVASGSNTMLQFVSPNSTIMVYNHQRIPFIAPLLIQNTDINKSQYIIASDYIAGNHVDENRAAGDVIVKSGTDYEVEFTGKVTLAPGFRVQKGARFSVTPSDY